MAAGLVSLGLAVVPEIPSIFHGIVGLIHGIEGLFGKGNGKAKKAALVAALSSGVEAYDATAQAVAGTKIGSALPQINSDGFQTALSTLIDAIIGFNNATGIFRTSTGV